MSYLAKFLLLVNGDEEEVFIRWIKSDLTYNHTNENVHNSIMQKLNDEQLDGSGFVFQCFVDVILEIYQVNDIQASSWVELPEKYKNNKSIINIKIYDQYCFLWFILAHLYPVEDQKK